MKKQPAPTVDVLSHQLNPEMKVISAAEKAKLLKKFSISESQLPKIFSTDPVAMVLKAAVGDIIRIERNDGTGKYTAYRIVIEDK